MKLKGPRVWQLLLEAAMPLSQQCFIDLANTDPQLCEPRLTGLRY